MPSLSHDEWVLPIGQTLVTTATATQRDLVDVLARARTAELCGLIALTSAMWQGHLLLFGGVPLFAHATNQDDRSSLLDRDAYEQLCLSFSPDPKSHLHLYRMDERKARALSGLFQSPALLRRLESASELRFLLEIVGGCHFEGCVQFKVGDERAVVLFHLGRPLGAYTTQERQIVTSLAGPLASILGRPNPEATFFPRPRIEPMPLPSSRVLNPSRRIASANDHGRPTTRVADQSKTTTPPMLPRDYPSRESDRAVFPSSEDHPKIVAPDTNGPPSGRAARQPSIQGHITPGGTSADLDGTQMSEDSLAESHMVWLLTALDRQWEQLKDKGLHDPALLTSLAGMVSLCLAKAESVRTRTPDVPADPMVVDEVVDYIQTRFPTVHSLRARGSRLDATPLLDEFRALNSRVAERAWLAIGAEALTDGLRLALSKVVEQVQSETVQRELRETYAVYLADVERDLHRFRAGMEADADGNQI